MQPYDVAIFVAASALGLSLTANESKVVTLPVASAALGYGLGAFEGQFCNFLGLTPEPEARTCQQDAHRKGIAFGIIGVAVAAIVMTSTDAWKKETRLI